MTEYPTINPDPSAPANLTAPYPLKPSYPIASTAPHQVGAITINAPLPISPIRIMLDSDVLGDLPPGVAQLLATYSDLVPSLAALAELQAHHKGSTLILIDRNLGDPTGLASVIDREDLAIPLGQLVPKYQSMLDRHIQFPTVYSDQNDLPGCDQAMAAAGFDSHWRWIARLDGIWDVPGFRPLHRPAIVQVVGENMIGLHCDGSLVLNSGWHPTP